MVKGFYKFKSCLEAIFADFATDEEGQTIVEYALMLVLVAIAVALAVPSVTDAVVAVFTRISTALGGGGGT